MFVLDASAVLRLLDREAGMDRVREIHNRHLSGEVEAFISSMHFGEIIGVFYRRHGLNSSAFEIAELRALQLTVGSVTAERAERGARIKAEHSIPYVDSLAVELASDMPNSVLITADFDMKPAERLVKIEFLLNKQKHRP